MHRITNQKYLKKSGLIILITVMNMVVPLSLDMYLPAVPHMTDVFDTTESVVNLTLVGFFFCLAIGILIFGPLSDKYGRKPLLIVGVSVYLIFSAACALTPTIELFISFRVMQALGAGCMMAVSTALIKDSFAPKTRNSVLAVVQAMTVIAPMVAPLIGAFILTFASWRATFWVLAAVALLCLVAVFLLEETVTKDEAYQGTLMGSMGRLISVGKNRGFSLFLILVAALSAPYMAYIAVCSYVYIDFFGLSETTYSYFFAVNSAASIIGPVLYVKLNGKISPKIIMNICIIFTVISGIALIGFGAVSPIIFMLAFLPFTVLESALRPFSTAILLEQQDRDTGSASSLINFTHTVAGSLGMILGALPWYNFIDGLGIILISSATLSVVLWIIILKRKIIVKGLTDNKNDEKEDIDSHPENS